MIKPSMSMCLNKADYDKLLIEWQWNRIEELRGLLKEARQWNWIHHDQDVEDGVVSSIQELADRVDEELEDD